MDEYMSFLEKIVSDPNKKVLTILNDSEFGKLVRYIENGKVICCIDGNIVKDKELYVKIEKLYVTEKDFMGIVE